MSESNFYWTIPVIVALVSASALMNGLTLGVLGLDNALLQVLMEQEVTDEESKQQADDARKIAPIRKNGNLLLVTLMLGTVSVGSALSIVMSDVEGSLSGFFISTTLIVIFGEIIPQAICARYGLRIGAKVVWIVKFILIILYVIAKPISIVLDYILGDDPGTKFSKEQMKALFAIYERESRLNPDQQKILSSALDFGETKIWSIMTPLDKAFMLNASKVLTIEKIKKIYDKGYSRIPVYEGKRENIIGILMSKDLMFVSADKFIKMWSGKNMLIRPVMTVNVETPIEGLLKDFKAGKSHIAVVHGVVNNGEKDPFYQPTGIITMEDIIEALMQQEIEDEHDLNRLKAETDQLHKANSVMLFSVFDSKDAITDMELEAIKNFIIKNIEPFNPTRISKNRLERLLKKARVLLLDGDEDEVDVSLSAIVYESDNSATDAVNYTSFDDRIPRKTLCQRGAACNYFYLILSGEVELRVGIEGIITSIGPYNCLGIKAVNEPMNTYIPDYTAKVNKPSRILRISQKLYLKYASLT